MDQQAREQRGVFVPDTVLEITGRSGEESIMANTAYGGRGDIIYPVPLQENTGESYLVPGELRKPHLLTSMTEQPLAEPSGLPSEIIRSPTGCGISNGS